MYSIYSKFIITIYQNVKCITRECETDMENMIVKRGETKKIYRAHSIAFIALTFLSGML
jgi:hypothetical protein